VCADSQFTLVIVRGVRREQHAASLKSGYLDVVVSSAPKPRNVASARLVHGGDH
jgi:hypothetical protein